MPGEVDPRLMNVLQGSMGLVDSLRDLGVSGEVNVTLGRQDGLRLLQIIAGASDRKAEDWSQRGRPQRLGFNSLRVAGVTFEWPQEPIGVASPMAAFSPSAVVCTEAANDNGRDLLLLNLYGFDEETPALR